MSGDATSFICAACGADMVCSEHGLSLPCDMCEAEGSAASMLCGSCGKTEAREAEFDPLICHACGKVYLYGDDDGLCDDPMYFVSLLVTFFAAIAMLALLK